MKRKGTGKSPDEKSTKRTRKSSPVALKETHHIRDEVEPYRLATAEFSINALSPVWSSGANRVINRAHVQRLCERFSEVGVLRRDASHRLLVLATKTDVQRMLNHLETSDQVLGGQEQPSFREWMQVVGKEAELLAGHHRVEALRMYVSKLQAPEEEGWWVCDVFDKGNPVYCTLVRALISSRQTTATYADQITSQSGGHNAP